MATGFDPQSLLNNSTLGQQAASAVRATGQTIERAATGIGSAVSSLASKLGINGLPGTNAIQTSVGKISELAPATKFKDTATNNTKLEDTSPELSRPDPSKNTPLQFPSDITTNRFIKFTFAAYYQPGPLFKREVIPQRSIILPIPGDLNERYGVQYSEKQLGVLGALQESGMLGEAAAGLQNLTEGRAREVGENLGKIAGSAGNAAAIARNVIGAISDSAGNAFDRATGTVLNPYSALQFTGIELRSHSFKYRLSPNSLAESLAIKAIVKEFKLRMLPEKRGLLFNFPDVCTIEFSNKNNALYYFKNCYLKSMNVNYAPSSTPAFFVLEGGGEFPAEVELTLEFGEIEPVTRNDVMKDDFTGQYGQAVSSDRQTPQA